MINYEMLNSNLIVVETIIDSRYHFRFVNLNDEDILKSELMMSILQARVISEGICRFIVLQKHFVKDEKNIRTATLKVYIDDLLRPNLFVPKSIISNLSTIQGISNLAVHFQVDGHLDLKQTYICLESLEAVLSWFVKEFGESSNKNNKWKISSDMLNKSGMVPPKAEGCVISRASDVDEIRKELIKEKVVFLRGYSGIGKTELIKDYVEKYKKKYDGIYYAENIKEIEDYIYDIPIGILDEEKKSKEEIILEKIDVIHSMGLIYLFIIDNYTGISDSILNLYPIKDDKYHVIISVSDDYLFDNPMKFYDVNSFSPNDSLKIFRFFCDSKYEDEDVMKLLSYLSYNPRAIKMSAAFLRDNDSYTPIELMQSMKKKASINSIIQNLYIVLTDISILENDENMKFVAECLSLIPYNGVSKERFIMLLSNCIRDYVDESIIESILDKLENSGWISIDNVGYISINPLLSDTIFEKTNPDMTSNRIVKFVEPILEPIHNIRELYIYQVFALEPFVDILTKRVETIKKCNLGILNDIREYYIAIYNLDKINIVTELMEQEFKRCELNQTNVVENAIFRQGISRFNLEDFNEAHKHFARALDMLNRKKIQIEKDIARISAYQGSSLAAIGEKESAIECAKKSIDIREKLAEAGIQSEIESLWISYYNYAKTLMELEMFEEANKNIDISTELYKKYFFDKYKQRTSINVSSLFQLKGRICAGLGMFEDAIKFLEIAKDIRQKLKGESYFSTAQIYSYLAEVYSKCENYEQALFYAQLFYDVLLVQNKTEDIEMKKKEVKKEIFFYKEKIRNDKV